MKEAIEQLIDDYERRIKSASKIMTETLDTDQFHRTSGKREACEWFLRDLKEVLSQHADNPGKRIPSDT
ncbi:hypothetical protein PN4B1_16800 [Paenibacillus naphthalenovorans]|uniref:hypothetical protein n=1 Tax=Paenibacillus naphthalenovorans TaxID=162209 RepID=UPI0010B807D6|nr:hypothetical protein [Paenibacillus naphthalenovorans]GCL71775.1 hypothetical protein PN4B1_16800 [Paenibacillus naphthalenovorans]